MVYAGVYDEGMRAINGLQKSPVARYQSVQREDEEDGRMKRMKREREITH